MFSTKGPVLTGLFILSVALLSIGCESKSHKLASQIVVQVNEHSLTAKDFSNQLARKLKQFDALAAKDPFTVNRAKEDIQKDFIVKSLTMDWAQAQKISVSSTELDTEIDKLRANYPDDLSFRRALAQENLSFAEWKDQLQYTLIEREVFKKLNEKIKDPSEEEIRRFYDQNKESFKRKERIQIRQIVVDDEAKIDAIKTALKNNDFAELAKKYSITPEAKEGGLVGWIEKGSVDYFDPLFSKSGTHTIKSPFGVHLIRIEKKSPASVLPLEVVRKQIKTSLRAQREQAEYIAWLDAQLRSSKVFKNVDFIKSIKIDTRGNND